jgi:serine/threonine-protein phosphatase 5
MTASKVSVEPRHACARLRLTRHVLVAAKKFAAAVELYTQSLAEAETAQVLGNRAFAQLKLEAFGLAIADASRALELDPSYIKGFYRRGSANLALGKYKDARRDFRQVLRVHPKDDAALKQLALCETEIRRIAFEVAIASDRTASVWDRLDKDLEELPVQAGYSGPLLPEDGTVTVPYVRELKELLRAQRLPPKRDVWRILKEAHALFRSLPSLIRVPIPSSDDAIPSKDVSEPASGCVCVMGDTHGQYYDTLHIFDLTGEPGPGRTLLFNGDFVDRGSFSVENILLLLAWKLACPDSMHLLRGNHETTNMNKVYGFEGEVRHKFCPKTMELFTDVFQSLPLAATIESQAMVCHGGLFAKDGVKLSDIEAVSRFQEPPESGIMSDILWSDPQPFAGRGPSKRGVGMSFGPDVTARFLDDNGLGMLIRSHEVKDEGYVVEHDGRCVTVFSAPNYCDQMGNKGAFVRLRRDQEPEYVVFSAQPHPPVRPMQYAGMGLLGGLGM